MRTRTASLALLAAAVLVAGCTDREGPLEPAPFGGIAPAAGIHSSFVSVRALGSFSCPIVQPFLGTFDLSVRSHAGRSLFLDQVRMTFTDATGLQAPSVTLPAPALTRQFGSTLIAARSQRTFPFSFPFGCFTRRTGTLAIVVVVRDDSGDEEILETSADIR